MLLSETVLIAMMFEMYFRNSQPLVHEFCGSRITDVDFPESAIGHPERSIEELATASGLRLRSQHLGMWPGRHGTMDYQDMLVHQRPPS
jgi:hypothetical protein